jgi:hypothetical protein
MITNETRIIDLTVAELQAIIGKTVKSNLPSPVHVPEQNIPDLLTVIETASLLGVSPETVYGYSHRKILTKKKIKGTRRIFFSRQECLKKLDEGLTKSNATLEQEATDFVHLKK